MKMQTFRAVTFFAVTVGVFGFARCLPILVDGLNDRPNLQEHRVKRIVNGNDAEPGQFPFQAWVKWTNPANGRNYFVCGAIVIHEYWVLTARHCTGANADEYTMVINDHKLFEQENEIIRKCVALERHDQAFWSSFMNDITLCRVADPIPAEYIVEMGEKGGNFVGQTCTISGWGATVSGGPYVIPNILQYTTGIIVDRQECQNYYDSLYGINVVPLNPMFHCIHNENSGACFGDSGGPMTCGEKLVGVTHAGMSNCDTKTPSIYMDITMPAYSSWINNIIKLYQEPVPA